MASEGGFFSTTPLSPPISTLSHQDSVLPTPRQTPLKPGSSKESSIINHIDSRLLNVSNKFERRFDSGSDQHESMRPAASNASSGGYRSFDQLANDLSHIVDVVWVTGTPSLQIPYFLSISLALADYLRSFPFSPTTLFPLLHKLDVAFASLLTGLNVENRDMLPDGGARRFTTTEKVRLRGVVEGTRITVVDASAKHDDALKGSYISATETESSAYETDADDIGGNEDRPDWDMETAKVYELTIGELGQSLDTEPVSSVAE